MRFLLNVMSGVVALALTAPLLADTLVTDNFTVDIESNCEEGVVVCDNVSYHSRSHKSGNELRLKGRSLFRMCADGVTPCQFIGYQFKNGNTVYRVLDLQDSGRLQVEQAGKTLVQEDGSWLNR